MKLKSADQSEKQPLWYRSSAADPSVGAIRSTPLTARGILPACGRGRFSGTMLSSALAFHGGQARLSLHLAADTATAGGVLSAASAAIARAPASTPAAAAANTHAAAAVAQRVLQLASLLAVDHGATTAGRWLVVAGGGGAWRQEVILAAAAISVEDGGTDVAKIIEGG